MKQTEVYNTLSIWGKLKWQLGVGSDLENLPATKARKEREEYWYGN